MITEWDSQFEHIGMKLRSITRDGWVCTAYEPGPMYEGTEGELYELGEDPLQWRNLWDDPSLQLPRPVADLVSALYRLALSRGRATEACGRGTPSEA